MRWAFWRREETPVAANGGEAETGTEVPAAEPFRPPPASVEGVAAAWEAVREARPAVERAKRAAPVEAARRRIEADDFPVFGERERGRSSP